MIWRLHAEANLHVVIASVAQAAIFGHDAVVFNGTAGDG